ncbi:hypothetical protein Tco_0093131 [Tanacetum coccineum]
MKVEESLNMTFDESPPPTKLSPLVDDDVGEEEAIRKNTKIINTNNEEDESIEVDKIINIKESKNNPLDQVIGNLNQRTLRSQAQNHSNIFCFISTIKPKNVNEALKDESWVVAVTPPNWVAAEYGSGGDDAECGIVTVSNGITGSRHINKRLRKKQQCCQFMKLLLLVYLMLLVNAASIMDMC